MTELREYTDKLIIAQIEIHAGLSMVDFDGVQIENNDFAASQNTPSYDAQNSQVEQLVNE
jgi:hypothetical protein